MKKIISTLVVLALFAGSIFALDLDVAFGGAYGFASLKTVNENSNETTKKADNAIGFKIGSRLGLSNDLGLKINAGFIFPTEGTKVSITDSKGNSTEATVKNDKAMVLNCFIGPVYTIKAHKNLKLEIGAGLDIAYNKYTNIYEETKILGYTIIPKSTRTTSYLSYGLGATFDAQYALSKKMSLQFGVDAAYLWGNKVKVVITAGDSTDTSSDSYKATGFYFIPDLSLVYRF